MNPRLIQRNCLHPCKSQGQKRSTISKLLLTNDSNLWYDNRGDMHNTAITHFHDFLTSHPSILDEVLLQVITSSISKDYNNYLMQPLSLKEVKEAILRTCVNSTIGLDGITTSSYQHCRDIVRTNLYHGSKRFFRGSHVSSSFLYNYVCIVPKREFQLTVGFQTNSPLQFNLQNLL